MSSNNRDKIMLQLADRQVQNFISYRVESDLFEAADSFELSLAEPDVPVDVGQACKLYVNGKLELTGIIDKITESGGKTDGVKLTLSGRDLMGLLVDSYAEDFEDRKDESLESLARRLLANVPLISRRGIIYGQGSKDRAVPLTQREEDYEFAEIHPARTIFEILKEYALARGLLFFALPDGTLCFGEPRTRGPARYTLVRRRPPNGRDNNIIDAERVRDISRRYSRVTVIAERQGTESYSLDDIYTSATVDDTDFPANLYKPFVAMAERDGQLPERYARVLMEKQKFEGFNLTYRVAGHSQAGKNYTVNEACHVIDDVFGIGADFLIYGRTFELSRDQGVLTTLKLSHLGVLPA